MATRRLTTSAGRPYGSSDPQAANAFLDVCMRVALFFDGKNHMKDLRRTASDRWLDHGKLADWVVEFVGGTRLAAAYYYTGIPTSRDES
jgi:hypothetical protein